MKSKFYLGLMALAALSMSSCSKDQVVSQAPEVNNAIAFDSYLGHAAQTKGQDITAENIRAFKVFGYMYDAKGGASLDWENAKSDFMPETDVTSEDGSTWKYSPLRYWPINQNGSEYTLNFYAYAPENAAVTVNKLDPVTGVITGKPSIRYSLPVDQKTGIANQVDVLWAAAEGQTKAANAEKGVDMNFIHALSKVTVNAYTTLDQATATVKINSMSIKVAQPTYVDVSLTDGKLFPATDAAERTYEIALDADNVTNKLPEAAANVCKDGNLYLIPTTTPAVKISINYTITLDDNDYSATFDVQDREINIADGLAATKAYKINININGNGDPENPEEFQTIEFNVDVAPWVDNNTEVDLEK